MLNHCETSFLYHNYRHYMAIFSASSKFLCEEDYKLLPIKKKFCFPTKSLGASSIALINPTFCGNTFSTDTRLQRVFYTY